MAAVVGPFLLAEGALRFLPAARAFARAVVTALLTAA
jgi:hypothetical protein